MIKPLIFVLVHGDPQINSFPSLRCPGCSRLVHNVPSHWESETRVAFAANLQGANWGGSPEQPGKWTLNWLTTHGEEEFHEDNLRKTRVQWILMATSFLEKPQCSSHTLDSLDCAVRWAGFHPCCPKKPKPPQARALGTAGSTPPLPGPRRRGRRGPGSSKVSWNLGSFQGLSRRNSKDFGDDQLLGFRIKDVQRLDHLVY